MFPKFSQKFPSPQIKEIENLKPSKSSSFLRNVFIMTSVISGFISATALLICDIVPKQINNLVPVVTEEFKNYIGIFSVLLLLSTFLHLFTCYSADVQSRKLMLIFLVMLSIFFVSILTWLAYYLKYIDNFVAASIDGWSKTGGSDKNALKILLMCENENCDKKIETEIRKSMMEIVHITIITLVAQLICKFIGGFYLKHINKNDTKLAKDYQETHLIILYNNNRLNVA